jgi:hypothetical protein
VVAFRVRQEPLEEERPNRGAYEGNSHQGRTYTMGLRDVKGGGVDQIVTWVATRAGRCGRGQKRQNRGRSTRRRPRRRQGGALGQRGEDEP